MERIPGKQPSPVSGQLSDMQGLDFPMYVYKPRRGVKRTEESKDTYKLPHRLIEKKRRDRINECIAQLKDLLPEHLKLTTLGHIEKAVVLELTLTHVKGLTSLLEQQQQKIFALQNGMEIDQPLVSQEKSEAMFRSGFHMCAKEVLQYLANQEGQGDSSPSHVINHLHKVASEALEGPARPRSPHAGYEEPPTRERHQAPRETPASPAPKPSEGHSGRNCVPVIQRVYAPAGGGEQSGSDTDTDSGYGGEPGLPGQHYGGDSQLKTKRPLGERWGPAGVKQEDGEPCHKRQRAESSEDESLSGGPSSSSSSSSSSSQSGYMSMSPQRAPPPLCLPFYLIPPSAAAYLPMLDKCWYPGSVPLLYSGLGDSAPGERPPRAGFSPRGGSPPAPHTPGDAPGAAPPRPPTRPGTLLQVLRQGPPLGRCKD